jgi:beta-glucosidase-like glycosyl hydrolase/CubicO group peptidase (beta-lactamase class C family)
MKIFLARIVFLIFLVLLVSNCASRKHKIVEQKNFEKPYLPLDTVIYIPHIKSERNTFFKDSYAETHWVDSIYNQLSLQEKVGQLFMVAAYSNKDLTHVNTIDKLISDTKIGGVIFFQGGPVRQANLTNRYQDLAKIPLFIGIDAEWGLSMRLDSTYHYPWNMTLGAIQDLKLVEKVGEAMGKESKRLGVHFDFAPVLDINTNPKNPIIGSRSFGENKVNVADKAIALMKGIQNQGVFSTGKHFPGHGDTFSDSHTSLPLVTLSREHLDLVELYPYKRMFDEGLVSVMVAHLEVPSLEPRPNYPTSISYNVVTNLLQNEMGFDGLIFTDALNMKGVSGFREVENIAPKPGDIELKAFLAGNNILLFPLDAPIAIEKICAAYQDKIISEERLAHSVKKILHYKFKAGLNKYKPIEINNLDQDLNPSSNEALQYQLFENAITVLKNKDKILPINNLENNKIAYVKLGDSDNSAFVSTLKKYTEIIEVSSNNVDSLNVKLKNFDTVIVSFHKSDKAWANQDFTFTELFWLQEIAKNNKVILDIMAKSYALNQIANFDAIEGLILSYQNSEVAQIVSAELIFGAIDAKGKLPVSILPNFKVNEGLSTEKLNRLGFTSPENVDMNPIVLAKIDAFAKKAIDGKMTPGLQVLVARKGKVIYQKSYGYSTYENNEKVTNSDLYDVASVSKMISTLPNVMQLYDQNRVTLDTKLGTMLPFFENSNKKDINFKELLSHYAGLTAWIPFYKATLDKDNNPSEKLYRKVADEQFSRKVAENLYIRNDYHDTIMKIIAESPLAKKKEYKYSDLTFMILKEYLELATNKKLDVLSKENFYNSLGMNYTMYNPLQKMDKSLIIPTEIDTYFRHQTIQGYVHDMGAAIEGGVSGHAGVFSNAMDVAKMMQLFLQKGNYGNHQYFSEKTFDTFNTCYFCAEGNRRGLGFDKLQLEHEQGPTCDCVSKESFGHTGFTGIMAWADPKTEIVYVFLSNRTFPANPVNVLSKQNIREDIQRVIQEAIIK